MTTWTDLNFLPRNYQPVAGVKHWLLKDGKRISIETHDLADLYSNSLFSTDYDLGARWAEIPAEVGIHRQHHEFGFTDDTLSAFRYRQKPAQNRELRDKAALTILGNFRLVQILLPELKLRYTPQQAVQHQHILLAYHKNACLEAVDLLLHEDRLLTLHSRLAFERYEEVIARIELLAEQIADLSYRTQNGLLVPRNGNIAAAEELKDIHLQRIRKTIFTDFSDLEIAAILNPPRKTAAITISSADNNTGTKIRSNVVYGGGASGGTIEWQYLFTNSIWVAVPGETGKTFTPTDALLSSNRNAKVRAVLRGVEGVMDSISNVIEITPPGG